MEKRKVKKMAFQTIETRNYKKVKKYIRVQATRTTIFFD
jgi:hypothetical protein